jgi:hypothetical protein
LLTVRASGAALRLVDPSTGLPVDVASVTAATAGGAGGITVIMNESGVPVAGVTSEAHARAEEGPDTELAVSDAATGAPRWTASIPFEPIDDVVNCGFIWDTIGSNGQGTPRLNMTGWASVQSTAILVLRCKQTFAFLADGTSIGDLAVVGPAAEGTSDVGTPGAGPSDGGTLGAGSFVVGSYTIAQSNTWSLDTDLDGGFIVRDSSDGDTILLDEAGQPRFPPGALRGRQFPTLLASVPAVAASPGVTTSAGMRIGFQAGRLAALGPDGALVWTAEDLPDKSPDGTAVTQLIARAGGVILAATGSLSVLAGYDEQDGSLLWSTPAPDSWSGAQVSAAVSDGRTAVLYTFDYEGTGSGATFHVTGIDLATGSIWDVSLPPSGYVLPLNVDGQLVEYSMPPGGSSITTTLDSGPFAGEQITTNPGRLALVKPAAVDDVRG